VDTEKILYLGSSVVSTIVNAFKPQPEDVKSILVVKLDEIGDMIYCLHCIEALHKQYNEADITVFCKPMNNALVHQTNCVSRVVNDINDVATHFDIQIDFRGNVTTLKRAVLGKCRIYLDRGSIRLKNKFAGGQQHEVETNQETIQWLFPTDYTWMKPTLRIPKSDLQFVETILAQNNLSDYVVMHCGARDESRRWPTNRFAQIIDAIYNTYGLQTVLVGSNNEFDLNQEVIEQANHAINLAGETNLLQLAALMRNCRFFVGNESGPLHFAIVEQKPLVALFGPGVKDVFYPLYDRQEVNHYFKDNHTQQTVENSTVLQIQVDEVLERIQQIVQ